MAPLPATDQRHLWLRYEVRGYTSGSDPRYEAGSGDEVEDGIFWRWEQVFVSHAWRRLFGIRGPLVREFILEFLSTCRMSDTKMGLDVTDMLCF
ncbi:hypothetical protein Tco_0395982, partial [Tanacetum coccineum]